MMMTKEQVLLEIEKFLSDEGGAHAWDDFTSVRFKDPALEKIRMFCADLPVLYPPAHCRQYCNEEGLNRLRKLASDLKKTPAPE
jgi:hypothetical protein